MKSLDTLFSPELRQSSPVGTVNLANRTNRLNEIDMVLEEIETWPGLVIKAQRNGLQLVVRGAPLGYLRWDGRLELPFPADIGDRLVGEEMAVPASDQSESERLVWIVRSPADVERAVWLLRLSYLLCCGDFETHLARKNPQVGETHGHLE